MSMIVVVIGVAGSGKTTVGTVLADAMHCPILEGDSLHPAANVEKMTRGIPLTDVDRAPWLAAITHGYWLPSGEARAWSSAALRSNNRVGRSSPKVSRSRGSI
jgi:gluconokinase